MTHALTIDPTSWPAEMRPLTDREAIFAVYAARGMTLAEAALAAGYSASNGHQAANAGHKASTKPHVRRAITALKAHHTAQHKETIYARA